METFTQVATFAVILFCGYEFFKFVHAEFNDDRALRDTLERIFQPGNKVWSSDSKRAYVVVARTEGMAYLKSVEGDASLVVDWLTPAMAVRKSVLDNWSMTASP